MRRRPLLPLCMPFPARYLTLVVMLLTLPVSAAAQAQEVSISPDSTLAKGLVDDRDSQRSDGQRRKGASSKEVDLEDATKIDGLITLYRKDNRLYAELCAHHYREEYIVLISIARGIGRNPLYGGMTWGNGDDWVWQFRKVDDRLMIVRRNVRFRADKGSPAATAIQYAYTDSVLFSEPLQGKGPEGGDLVDLTSVFMSDLPQISQVLPNFYFSADKSTWAEVKGFTDNVEIEVAATYASNGRAQFDSVPDSRGVTINVHYSISKIKASGGYKPRLADDRIGYFLTVVKDYSKNDERDRFVRYIDRWWLEKADDSAELSPPKKPLIFWLENTIPYQYRQPIREGILEWNKAFAKAGFVDAIEVRQQPDGADWDAEDVNYNTFRWITASAGFAMGPSRVNPYTGQILDADIIFDADFLQYWKQDFETLTEQGIAEMTGGPLDYHDYLKSIRQDWPTEDRFLTSCMRRHSIARQFAFGQTAVQMLRRDTDYADEMEKMIRQGLKGTVMHEVGHTLGLRHNFKGSSWLNLVDMNKVAEHEPMIASVMDYDSVNIVPPSQSQGQYFTGAIGPYDYWAIEYGYRPFDGQEAKQLAEIASRSGEEALRYAADEETRGFDVDPLSNRWDLGRDPLEFADRQAELVRQLMADVVQRMTGEGEDYSQARQSFNVLLSTHGQAMFFAARLVGGIETNRSHKGDPLAEPPLKVIPAQVQRKAMGLLAERVFRDKPFEIPAELYQYLISSRWVHWGTDVSPRVDYPIHDVILMWQSRILDQLLSSTTLTRIHDTEHAVEPDVDCYTAAELIDTLTSEIFAEILAPDFANKQFTAREPGISSLRRNLQRSYMKYLARMALGQTAVPEDCQTLAFSQLKRLKSAIDEAIQENTNLDDYSQSHLDETASRIQRILEARFTEYRP